MPVFSPAGVVNLCRVQKFLAVAYRAPFSDGVKTALSLAKLPNNHYGQPMSWRTVRDQIGGKRCAEKY
jgi:hypothetical protein